MQKLKCTNFLKYSRKVFSQQLAKQQTIPGVEPDDPEWGNVKEIKKTTFYHWMSKRHEELGPIFSFWINKDKVCSISHPKYYKELANLNTRSGVYFNFLHTLFGQDNLNMQSGLEWHERNRVYVHPTFQPENVLRLHQKAIEDSITLSYDSWNELAESGEAFSLQKVFARMIIRIMIRVLFGVEDLSKYDIDEIHEAQTYSSANVGDQSKEKKEIELEKFYWVRGQLRELTKDYYKIREANPDGPKICYLDFVREKDADFEYVFIEAVTMFFSGVHTSNGLFTLATYHLATNPLTMKKLQQNLDKAYDGPLNFDLQLIRKVRYLRDVMRETTRVTPLVNFTTRTDFEKDIIYEDGMTIPKGMEIMIFMSHAFENPEIWNDVDTFNPERFKEIRGEGAIPFQFSPFGYAGGRVCPGKYLAQYEIGTAIATLFKNFDVKIVNKEPLQMMRLTANSVKGDLYATLHKRNKNMI